MLVGYNTNISYKDKIYHIQTEDNGTANPVIVTLLYFKGAILASKKTSYTYIVHEPDCKEKVRELMKEQHKSMIKELLKGKYTGDFKSEEVIEEVSEKIAEETTEETFIRQEDKDTPETQVPKSLDDILINYIIKRNK